MTKREISSKPWLARYSAHKSTRPDDSSCQLATASMLDDIHYMLRELTGRVEKEG